MKYIIVKTVLLHIFLIAGFDGIGQANNPGNYLLVRYIQQYDNTNQKYYFTLNPEEGCDSAKTVYILLKYDNKRNAVNKDGQFYHATKDSSGGLYNYFLTQTEGLNYMRKNGWILHSIFTETFSGYDNQTTGAGQIVPVTTVSSRPVFCFMK